MAVTAKFKASRLTRFSGQGFAEVELTPDYAGGKNKQWANATPQGVIRLSITNLDAVNEFVADDFEGGMIPYNQQRSFTVTFEEEE